LAGFNNEGMGSRCNIHGGQGGGVGNPKKRYRNCLVGGSKRGKEGVGSSVPKGSMKFNCNFKRDEGGGEGCQTKIPSVKGYSYFPE